MDLLTLDFETYYSKDYGLKKLTVEEYVRDDRFEMIICGCKLNDGPTHVFDADQFSTLVEKIDWSKTAVLCHNTQFDGFILKERYGVVPAFYLDTLSMSNALQDGVKVGGSLAFLVQKYGLGEKGKEVLDAIGKRAKDFSPDEMAAYRGYCANDVELTYKLYHRLKQDFPASELKLIDMTTRMFCDPKLELDTDMLNNALDEEQKAISDLLDALGVVEEDLASNAKFADILKRAGFEPPTKISPTTGKEMYAFAKNDVGFQNLMNSDIQASLLCKARMAVKSTQKRTRSKRMAGVGGRGPMPVPLKYWGASTGRWSGSQRLNLQNLKRGSDLRAAIMAPEGHTLVVSDLSQIEPRVLAWYADDEQLLDMLRTDDPYALFAARMFGIPDLTKKTHPELRQAGKSALLGAGYGLGWLSFASQLMTGFMGADPVLYDMDFAHRIGMSRDRVENNITDVAFVDKARTIPHTCTDRELLIHATVAQQLIYIYRNSSPRVTSLWRKCDDMIRACAQGSNFKMKNLTVEQYAVRLPSGMRLLYPALAEEGRGQWHYGAKKVKLYGSKLVENIVQAVARCVMSDAMLKIQQRYPVVLTVHDEAVVLVPDEEVEEAKQWVHAQMIADVPYLQGIPLAAETEVGKRYGEAK